MKGLSKPILSNAEVEALAEINVSAAVDRAHMGLMTALADLNSIIVHPVKRANARKSVEK